MMMKATLKEQLLEDIDFLKYTSRIAFNLVRFIFQMPSY